MQITLSIDDVIARYASQIADAGAKAPQLMANGLNAGGRALRRETIAAEVAQTGLSKRTIGKAQREHRATASNLAYVIKAGGGDVRLKFFGARETAAGVSAAPWAHRRVFPGTFIKGGRFPGRVALNMGGHVFRREGSGRLPIEGRRSGLFIATEMVTGETASAFTTGSSAALRSVTMSVGRVFGAS